MKQLARLTIQVILTLAVLIFVWRFRGALALLLVAITIAILVAPGIRRLSRRGVPRLLAIGTVYAAVFLVAGLLLWAISGVLLAEWEQIAVDLDQVQRHMQLHWREGSAAQQYIAELLPPAGDPPSSPAADGAAVRGLVGIGGSVFSLSIAAFLTVVVAIYWSIDYWRIERLWLLLLPLDHRVRARRIWRQMQAEVGAYMRSELFQAAIAGIVLGLLFWWGDFPYPATMAALVAVTWLVPWLGAVLAVAAIWAASLLNVAEFTPVASAARAAVGSGLILLVFAFLDFFVEPRLIQHQRYSWLLVLVLTVSLLYWIGLIGLFLGAPVAIAVQVLLGRLLYRGREDGRVHQPHDIAGLRQRLVAIRQRLEQLDDPHALALTSIIQRLDELLEESDESLPQECSTAGAESSTGGPENARPVGDGNVAG